MTTTVTADDEPMMTERWTEAETLAVLNGATPETPAIFPTYSENFFEHGFQDARKNSEEMQRILSNLENSAKVGVLAGISPSTKSSRETGGYAGCDSGSQFWNQGRTREIRDRVMHLD